MIDTFNAPTPMQSGPTPLPTRPDPCKDGTCDKCLKGGMPMKKEILSFLLILCIGAMTVLFVLWVNEKRQLSQLTKQNASMSQDSTTSEMDADKVVSTAVPSPKVMSQLIDLPKPNFKGVLSVEEALFTRRSRREFSSQPVSQFELGQILWSGQGVTDDLGHRTSPSAREGYPFTEYVVVRNVEGLQPGLYQYLPEKHQIGYIGLANAGELLTAAGVQDNSQNAPVVIALSGAIGKMVKNFPTNATEVTMIEAGHIGQNIYLQVESMGMSTVVTAGFDVAKVGQALQLDPSETVVYLIPLGHRSTVTPTQSPENQL
ncbi:MAG: SagB/ThcOx family dehydrogenase [Patescibacteria group bacterium]